MKNLKEFNYTGTCIPHMHYMVDISQKLDKIIKFIKKQKYFTINRPRQYGKTTTIFLLKQKLMQDYIVISISFEGKGIDAFKDINVFSKIFIGNINKYLNIIKRQDLCIKTQSTKTFDDLSDLITNLTNIAEKKIVLLIDEVDKATNYVLFYNFLGMLRNKYLKQIEGEDTTFHSVILAGVHDIKNIKMKIRNKKEFEYNSPWNIAIDFDIDMSFSANEISTMLADYEKDYHTGMDIDFIAENLRLYTSGYPYLVSKLCYIMDEKLNKNFSEDGLKQAIQIILLENNTLFDDLIKNLNQYQDLNKLLEQLILEGLEINYNHHVHNLGIMYGFLGMSLNHKLKVHNKIFEILLYDYFIAKRELKQGPALSYKYEANFIDDFNHLDMELILLKFQELLKAEYREVDEKFVEREGRLLFLAFLKPIINGKGFYFVEPETRKSNRMDVVVTFNQKLYVIELKIWRGKKYALEGRKQLCNYLEIQNVNKGYLIFFSFNKNKTYNHCHLNMNDKEIFEITV